MKSKQTLYGSVFVALLLALVSPVWAIKVDDECTLYADPTNDWTGTGVKALANGGYYTFKLEVLAPFDQDWEIVPGSVVWTKPNVGLFTPSSDGLTATWQSINDGMLYTVEATGKMRKKQQQPAAEKKELPSFDSMVIESIYHPVMFWSSPTGDLYLREGQSMGVSFGVEFWADTSHTETIESGDMGIEYELQEEGGSGSTAKAHFPNETWFKERPIGSGVTSDSQDLQITAQAQAGEKYYLKTKLLLGGTAKAELAPTPQASSRITVYKIDFSKEEVRPGVPDARSEDVTATLVPNDLPICFKSSDQTRATVDSTQGAGIMYMTVNGHSLSQGDKDTELRAQTSSDEVSPCTTFCIPVCANWR